MSDDSPSPHRRRPRYRGTHPRRFDEKYKEHQPERFPGIVEHVRARGATPAGMHVPIMVGEVMEVLRPAPGDVVADCTLGYGGHAAEFLRRIGPQGRLVGFDVDGRQIERTAERLRAEHPGAQVVTLRSNFAGLPKGMAAAGVDGFDVIFADLGVSSMQIDDPSRGFSYKHPGPLDMRMDDRIRHTAADLLAKLSAEELADALERLADEPDHLRIARAIVRTRATAPIRTTRDLVRVVLAAKGIEKKPPAGESPQPGRRELHPAARTFQALRILVNDELGSLAQFLRVAPHCLRAGGRLGVLTFHSGEARLVREAWDAGRASGVFAAVSDEPMRPSAQERYDNPRSSSARLHWAVRAMPAE